MRRFLPLGTPWSKGLNRPSCMDRLPFASEGVLSEVADMYPAC
jgi:hypothetical protein